MLSQKMILLPSEVGLHFYKQCCMHTGMQWCIGLMHGQYLTVLRGLIPYLSISSPEQNSKHNCSLPVQSDYCQMLLLNPLPSSGVGENCRIGGNWKSSRKKLRWCFDKDKWKNDILIIFPYVSSFASFWVSRHPFLCTLRC